jgi:hypothetical protein
MFGLLLEPYHLETFVFKDIVVMLDHAEVCLFRLMPIFGLPTLTLVHTVSSHNLWPA